MFRLLIVSLIASLVAAAPGTTKRASKPEQLRAVTSPVFHFYMQTHPTQKTKPVLGPEKSSEYYNIGTTVQSVNTSQYINIVPSSTSYKSLVLSATSNTTAWGLEGDTLITTTGSTFGRQLNFLACDMTGGYYEVFLQTGSEVPSGRTCSNYQTLHLPCLC